MIRGHADADKTSAAKVIAHLGMKKLFGSKHMFGANCPLCGGEHGLVIWENKAIVRCYKCGLEGEFRRSHERTEEDGHS